MMISESRRSVWSAELSSTFRIQFLSIQTGGTRSISVFSLTNAIHKKRGLKFGSIAEVHSYLVMDFCQWWIFPEEDLNFWSFWFNIYTFPYAVTLVQVCGYSEESLTGAWRSQRFYRLQLGWFRPGCQGSYSQQTPQHLTGRPTEPLVNDHFDVFMTGRLWEVQCHMLIGMEAVIINNLS